MNRRVLLSLLASIGTLVPIPAFARRIGQPLPGREGEYLVLYRYEDGEWKPKTAWELT